MATPGTSRSRTVRAVSIIAATAAVLTLLPTAAPALASPPSRSFQTGYVTVMRNGHPWKMDISGYREYGQDASASITVDLVLMKNPDGSGPLWADQSHSWSFDVSPAVIDLRDDLTGVVDTQGQLGDFGRIRLEFEPKPDEPLLQRCRRNGTYHDRERTVRVTDGPVAFRTMRGEWGTITERPTVSYQHRTDGGCTYSFGGGQCPDPYRMISGYSSPSPDRFVSMSADELPGAQTARISVSDSSDQNTPGDGSTARRVYLYHAIDAVVPAERVHVDGDLSPAWVEGGGSMANPGWDMLSGAATFAADGPAFGLSPENCGTDRQQQYVSRSGVLTPGHGSVTAGLRGHMIGFPEWTLGSSMDGSTSKYVISNR